VERKVSLFYLRKGEYGEGVVLAPAAAAEVDLVVDKGESSLFRRHVIINNNCCVFTVILGRLLRITR